VLPAAMKRAEKGCILIALIKPQFEVGKGMVGKGGVVRDPELHQQVCDKIEHWLRDEMDDWNVIGLTQSPIKGPEGNIEFLIGARYEP
jgi:23S rRNA (cytidine1920-2'-O)/16S rRNA (cytidine1409-2'-O)-methyltransferase